MIRNNYNDVKLLIVISVLKFTLESWFWSTSEHGDYIKITSDKKRKANFYFFWKLAGECVPKRFLTGYETSLSSYFREHKTAGSVADIIYLVSLCVCVCDFLLCIFHWLPANHKMMMMVMWLGEREKRERWERRKPGEKMTNEEEWLTRVTTFVWVPMCVSLRMNMRNAVSVCFGRIWYWSDTSKKSICVIWGTPQLSDWIFTCH